MKALWERTWRFEFEILARISTRVVDVPFGRAFLDEDLPDVWDSNRIVVERGRPDLDDLLATAEEIQGGVGLRHRRLTIRDEIAEQIGDGLISHGFHRTCLATMVLRQREPVRPEARADVRALTLEEVAPTRRAFFDEDTAELVAGQLEQRGRKLAATTDVRYLGVVHQDTVVSACEVYLEDGIAQIEDVITLPRFRGRGYGRAVVEAAIRMALVEGSDVTFLVADANDWPYQMYARIGFEEVGRRHEYNRMID